MDATQFLTALEETRSRIQGEIKDLEGQLSLKRGELSMLPGRKRAQRSDKGQPRKTRIDAEDAVDATGPVVEVVEDQAASA